MDDKADRLDETTPFSSRDWVKAAVWLGALVLIGVAALAVLYSVGVCGRLTRSS